ncbi:preprotein translocase [Pollutimonas subterranea]|uniref:Preprotein translocase n=1 Tax=Pollutimonas subterranea TaxID=2045210 RepID=A0A2N4TZ52_9BURK|nr:integrase arm-type DNA-binding domain-containing protein [Pollutimonas subterranea]PLC48041.1 preprotein translocase [Pollutimonas subterranea]
MSNIKLTPGRIASFTCPAGKQQAFMRDTEQPGLGVRVTAAGTKSYIFQGKLAGQVIRITIGDLQTWSVTAARDKAAELRMQIRAGRDPREVKQEVTAADVAKREHSKRKTATVADAWDAYLKERRPHWSALHYRDHVALAQVGGETRKRLKEEIKTIAGPLAEFMPLRLSDVTPELMQEWAKRETPKRPARVRLAIRLFKAFLRWCSNEKAYRDATDPTAASAKKVRDTVGASKPKNDHLQKEQLVVWFEHVQKIPNPTISAYLQCLLLTGARREELLTLQWEDVNFQWRGISMRDKIEGTRQVPLTPYVMHLMAGLPRRNGWVFSSPTSKSGRLAEPSIAHRRACAAAGLDGLTLHGLRRSFASLCEWLDIPGGISAQIQGHAPQGVREQNYIRRPLDLLRVHHDKIEGWLLMQAKIQFDAEAAPGSFRVVGGTAA